MILRPLSTILLMLCLGLAVLQMGCTATNSSATVSFALESDRLLALLPKSHSYMSHLSWHIVTTDGGRFRVSSDSDPAWPQLRPRWRTTPQGLTEVFLARGVYEIPKEWQALHYSLAVTNAGSQDPVGLVTFSRVVDLRGCFKTILTP